MSENIGNKVQDKTYIPLPPFKGWVLENFPFIEADFDCLTNYEMICKMITEINNVISNQNQVQDLGTDIVTAYNALVDAVNLAINAFEEDITGDFNDLKNYVDNYFDNNFPELLSNKLDEMAEDGTLESLLNDAAHLTKSYNTYTDMIADSATFTNGLRLKTLGYYNINDGGSAEYYVNNSVISTNYQIDLENGLYLNLVYKNNTIYPCQLGAKHTLGQDDSSILQTCLDILHQHNIKCLDLQDYIYYISNPLHLDSTYNCTIQNGKIYANDNFTIDGSDTSVNYLLYLTNVKNTEPIGYYGHASNDLSLINLTFDCKLISGLGCLSLKSFLRMTINNCVFHRYTTDGIYIDDVYSHELICTNSTFVAKFNEETNTTAKGINGHFFDCIFSNLVIVGGAYGIYLDQCQANLFSKIHTYQLETYGIYMSKCSQNTLEQMYIDGKGVYILNPWLTSFVNCYFLTNVIPITLDKENNNVTVYGLNFIGCVGRNFSDNTYNLIYLPNGYFSAFTNSTIDVTLSHNITDNSKLLPTFENKNINKCFIDSTTTNVLLSGAGAITNSTSISGRYTANISNNIINVTDYNNSGYTWAGFVVSGLTQNKDYLIIDNINKNQELKVIGFNSLADNTEGTIIKNNSTDKKYATFNTGTYTYIVIAFYGKKNVEPLIFEY